MALFTPAFIFWFWHQKSHLPFKESGQRQSLTAPKLSVLR